MTKRLLLPVLSLFFLTTALGQQGRPQAGPVIHTEKTGYFAGEPVTITGAGFQPFERVSLLVTHTDGSAEAGAGHERLFVNTNRFGAFETTWSVSTNDIAGTSFVVTAAGATGSTQLGFVRVAKIATDKPSYGPGNTARITAEGFNPNELVTIHAVEVGRTYELAAALADRNGRVTVNAILPTHTPGADFTISATSDDSHLTANVSTVSLTGRVVYHSYVSYGDGSSQLFILNLSNGSLTNISKNWTNLVDAMNGQWSPDGSKIVFMARPKKNGTVSAYFNVFLYTVGHSGNPVNLTNDASHHDEDPKFSPDGTKIVYKVRPSILREMDLNGSVLNTIISSSGTERSMPFYTADGSAVWYSNQPGDSTTASIYRTSLDGSGDSLVIDNPNVWDAYPIRDTIGQFLFVRWVSPTNLHDQVYMFDGATASSLAFNTPDADYADPYPVYTLPAPNSWKSTPYVVLASTTSGGRGGFDLYIADRNAGTMWSLSAYNSKVNTNRQELGASYIPF
jgi:hypothetical protein